jgi:hypothetical protein
MRLLKAIVVGGMIAGALDITYAFIVYGPLTYQLSPVAVLQSVASGWLGDKAASAGGTFTALLGSGTHLLLATVMAAVIVLSATKIAALKRNPGMWGLIYGLGLYLVMTYLVLPLSAAHRSQNFAADLQDVAARLQVSFSSVRPKNRWLLLGALFTHMVLVGMPISLINKRLT